MATACFAGFPDLISVLTLDLKAFLLVPFFNGILPPLIDLLNYYLLIRRLQEKIFQVKLI